VRIVSLSVQNAMLPLRELGVTPVASTGGLTEGDEEFFRRVDDFDTSSVEWIGICCDANVEAVASARPDLIVTDVFAGADQYDLLLDLAPVARIDPFDQPLVDALAAWADLVGGTPMAEQFRSDYDARVESLIDEIGDPAEVTVAVITAFNGGSSWEYADDGQATGQVVDDLGVRRPTLRPTEYEEFSLEVFPDHLADLVIVYDFGGAESPDAEIDAFVDSRVFRSHPAVAAGQWLRVDATQTVGSGWTKLDNLLDVVGPVLAASSLDRKLAR